MAYYIIDILGTIAFAISGVLVAMNKRLDIFGIFIIAFVTAVGGGTLRDVLVGQTPVSWMVDGTYMVVIIGTVILTILFNDKLKHLSKTLFLFDSIGIGLYTIIGIKKGLSYELLSIMCILLGTITACFGGVIRDILCNEIPIIFRKEIYATACILGGVVYFLLEMTTMDSEFTFIGAMIIIIVIRLFAVKFKISLPNIYPD